jgi:hypothetical protein
MYYTFKQIIRFYTSNKILYNYFKEIKDIDKYFYKPKSNQELYNLVRLWYNYRNWVIKKYGHISKWNTVNITDMSRLFKKLVYFNSNIRDWNTSNVINMDYMFNCAYNFNRNIIHWNILKVKSMRGMLLNACAFKHSLYKWNLSKEQRDLVYYNRVFRKKNVYDYVMRLNGSILCCFNCCTYCCCSDDE